MCHPVQGYNSARRIRFVDPYLNVPLPAQFWGVVANATELALQRGGHMTEHPNKCQQKVVHNPNGHPTCTYLFIKSH